MVRERISTTVDGTLLAEARRLRTELNDATLLDEALAALLPHNRAVEVEDSYSAYDDQPIGDADAWGDLESFHEAAAKA